MDRYFHQRLIFLLQRDLFLLKFMIIKRDDFDFDIVNFSVFGSLVTFLGVLIMVFTFLNLLGLLESAIMLRTSTLEINV